MNKVFRRLVSAATTAALVATMIPAGIIASATSSALPLYLNKTAVQKTGSTNEWNLTLTVSGSSSTTKTTSDIVLVFDASGSMGGSIGSARTGAKELVDTVLSGDRSQTTRVAAVAFSDDIDSYCDLSNNAGYVDGVINGFGAGGGTNTQLGIHQAEQLLSSSTATNKIIVLLSDGDPTYSYKASSATIYNSSDNPLVSYSGVTRHGFTLSDFDYSYPIGYGRSYSLGKWDKYYAYDSGNGEDVHVTDNGIGTISEALIAKNNSIGFYTIGYNLDGSNSNGKYVLRNIASSAGNYYVASSTDISATFASIAGSIDNRISATASKVIDTVGSHFDLESGTISTDSGTATIAKDGNGNDVITWNTGDVSTNVKTLTYTVKLREDGATGVLPTNESAVINYTDSNGNSASMPFPQPTVNIYSYTVNYFKDNGAAFKTDSGRLARDSVFSADTAGNLPTGYSLSGVKDSNGAPVSADPSGKYSMTLTSTNSNNVLNVYYTKNSYGYTVNYLEQGTDKVLNPAKSGTAIFGNTVTEDAVGITGYSPVAANGSVVIGTGSNVINLYYTKNSYGYTVNYLEQGTDKVLNPAKSGTAIFGNTVTEDAVGITGYSPVAANGSVVIGTGSNVINLYYTKNSYGYTVNYLEKDTNNVLSPAKTASAKFGDTVTENAIGITGYSPVAANGSVVIGTGSNVINLYYTKNSYGYTVNYLEQGTGNVLSPAKTASAKFGDTVTENAIGITGYSPVAANGSVVIGTGSNVINLYYTKNSYGYTVNYLEQGTGNVLSPAKTASAKFGNTVTENAIAITGYSPVAASGSVVIGTGSNVINLYYTKNSYGYTVNYLEQGTNNVLSPAKTASAKFGDTVTENAIAITGYTAVKDSDSVVIKTDGNVINLYYTKNSYGYTVNYLEQGTDKVLNPAKSGTAIFGDTVTEDAVGITGYSPVAANGSVVIGTEGNVINLYYTKNSYGYTVNYLEQGTNNVLSPAKSGIAKFGDTVTEDAVAITGYTAVSPTGSVVIKTEGNVINLYYTKNSYGYTVNYLEQGTNNVLSPAKTASAKFGDTVTEDAVAITGYTAVSPTGSVVIKTEGNVINLYYTKNSYGYTVNYLEQGTNNVLSPAKTGTAKFGDTVTEDAIGITGYSPAAANGSVVIKTDGNVINLYYTKNSYGYTVNYLEQGTDNVLSPAKTTSAKFGETVTENAVAITGYTAVSPTGSVVIKTEGNVINLYYTANVTIDDDDTPHGDKPADTDTVTILDDDVPLGANPTTGDSGSALPLFAAASGLAVLAAVLAKRKGKGEASDK